MDDILIRGGFVIDGTGAAGRHADVALRDGQIAKIGTDIPSNARRIIDAADQVVAPGFIDIHAHSDYTLPLNPRAESKIRQGVTTEVLGNCGFSVAPALPGRVPALRNFLSASAPWYEFREQTFSEYANQFPATAVNTVLQVGHGTLRVMAMGMENRAPSPEELSLMQKLLQEALEAGALGMSSGLFTAPGAYAARQEMVGLGEVLRRHRGWYSAHVRDEANHVFDAVREAIGVGEHCGVQVQIAHLKLSGTDNWGNVPRLLGELEAARERGVKLNCDQYPYTIATSTLRIILPPWLQEGGLEAMLERAARPAVRSQIRDHFASHGLNNFGRIPSWSAVRVSLTPSAPKCAGKTIADIAHSRARDPVDVICDLLIADRGQTRVLVESMSESDVQQILRSPSVMIGSDGIAVAPYGITSQGKPHPRYYGTFARVLGHYVRELGALSLPQAIHKMTGGSAAVLGLKARGVLREGYQADLTIFDPRKIADMASYDDPHRYANGISTVIVNGTSVIDAGEHTGALPGRVLRRRSDGVH